MSLPMKSGPVTIGDELVRPPAPVNRRDASAVDAAWRLTIRVGYRILRLWWFLRRPAHRGALVALWHNGEILLVRTSYRRRWGLPGGGIDSGESAQEAALRELREEIGLDLPPEALRPAYADAIFWEHRHDHTTIFEAELGERPSLRLDNREILAAVFRAPATIASGDLTPPVARYLAGRKPTPSSASTPAAEI
jgi:8-oxo-dGTP diphosphatase